MAESAQFFCVRCGNCCRWEGYVRVSDDEIANIAHFLNLSITEFTDEYTIVTNDRTGLSLREQEDGSCVFFIQQPPSCRIQDAKPQQCRNFPYKWNFDGWENECRGAAGNTERTDES